MKIGKTGTSIIVAILVIILIVVLVFVFKSSGYNQPDSGNPNLPPQPPVNANSNILNTLISAAGGWLANLLGPKGGTTNNSGYTTVGNCVGGCDTGKTGYNCDGFPDPINCNFG